jgi:hypothetical protein
MKHSKIESMTVAFEIPDDLAGVLTERAMLESVALEGYRTGRLSESAVRRFLGFETRMEVHGFLRVNDAYLQYGAADPEHDLAEARRYVDLLTAGR